MLLPTFVIAGVPRAGTTSLAAHMAGHPDIFMSEEKELHFFDARFARGLEWYGRHFEGSDDVAQRGEATPVYVVKPDALRRMGATLPDVKLIIALRDPVDRAYSHYWLNRWRGIEPLSFEDALDAEESRFIKSNGDTRRAYCRLGNYAAHLGALRALYPREQVLTVFFEDLRTNPDEVLREVFRHLEISDYTPPNLRSRHNHHGPARSARVAWIARRLPGPLCRAVRDWNADDGEYPAVQIPTRTMLDARFADMNRNLEELVGRPIPWAEPDAEALRGAS